MTFTVRDLRPGMDVFSLDTVYLGTVVRVRWEGSGWLSGGRWKSSATVSLPQGEISGLSGERLGPMPTSEIGNGGPEMQSVTSDYASQGVNLPWDAHRQPAELLIFRWLVALNWATARPVLRKVPARLIQLVSMERIVLSVDADELGRHARS